MTHIYFPVSELVNREDFFKMNLNFLSSLSLCIGVCLCANEKIRMIADVITSYEQPTAVIASVCWIITDKTALMTELMRSKKASTVSFVSDHKQITKFDPKNTFIVTDLNCRDSGRFLQQADKNNWFVKPYRWLIIPNDFGDLPIELTKFNILVDSEVAVAEKIDNDKFKLNLVYRIDSSSEYRQESFGIWNATEGFQISEDITRTTLTIRRKNLSGKVIAASFVITDNITRTQIHDYKNLKVDSLARVTYHNILPLFDFMNATKAMLFTNTWGYHVNNSWNGMMGDIIHGEAELCGTVSFMRLERVSIIQYITQPVPFRPKFVFREPPLSFQNNLFILPFKSAVWMSIGGLVVILIIIIYINAKWERTKDEDFVIEDPSVLKANVSDIGIFIISAITQQGTSNEMKGSLGRVVTFLMFLIFLFLYTSYSANIVALLQSSSDQIKTLSDLLNSKLELGVEDESYNKHYFPAAKDPVRKAIYENKIAKVGYKPNFMSVEEGVKRLQNKDAPFAFHMNVGIGYKIVEELFHEEEKCGLHEIEYHPNSVPWLCSRKVSPYREIYRIGLARTIEHGLADRVNRIFYVRRPYCNTRGGSFASVNMVDFHPVLLWMLYGIILSVLLLMAEILMFRRQNKLEKI